MEASTTDCFAWCTLCGERFTEDEVKVHGQPTCPSCGAHGVPCGPSQDFRLEINWHELRILVIWAENYARAMDPNRAPDEPYRMTPVVQAIARRLQNQVGDSVPALTLTQEIQEIRTLPFVNGLETEIPDPMGFPINGPGAVGHSRDPKKPE